MIQPLNEAKNYGWGDSSWEDLRSLLDDGWKFYAQALTPGDYELVFTKGDLSHVVKMPAKPLPTLGAAKELIELVKGGS
jgi:hypothetical protein